MRNNIHHSKQTAHTSPARRPTASALAAHHIRNHVSCKQTSDICISLRIFYHTKSHPTLSHDMSSKENIRPLQNHMPTRNSSKSSIPRTARPDTVPLGIKGMALADDSANSNPPAKVQMVKVTKKDELMEKMIKGLEKRVDCNAHVNRDKSMSKIAYI